MVEPSLVTLWDTGLPADTVELVGDNIISVGTYFYDPTNRQRTGHLDFLALRGGMGTSLPTLECLDAHFTLPNKAGILDAKWHSLGDGNRFGGVLACSDGSLAEGIFSPAETSFCLTRQLVLDSQAITMGIDRCARSGHLAAALSSGQVMVSTADGHILLSPTPHSLEAWTVAWDAHYTSLLHSGGDDARWVAWDLAANTPAFSCSYHQAGVCSIQPHPSDEQCIITGSYDKELARWDRRQLRRPLSTIRVGSGVWKLRWNPSKDSSWQLLAACMYNGYHIFDLTRTEEIVIKKSYDPGALSYGCAWVGPSLVATCSFYNCQVQVWGSSI